MKSLIKTLIFISVFALCLGAVPAFAAETYVRVGLYYSSTALNGSAQILSPGGVSAGYYEDDTFTEAAKIPSEELFVYIDDGKLVVGTALPEKQEEPTSEEPAEDVGESAEENVGETADNEASQEETADKEKADGVVFECKAGEELVLKPAGNQSGTPYIQIGGKKYPELMKFSIDENGRIKVINVVSLEQYIKGVLPNEVFTSWEPEALKAAAVATRTYTLKSLNGKHSSQGFDLCTTTDCQVYAGVSKTAASTNSAADETRGQVLKYNGALAETVYHAISGGITESASGAWGGSPEAHPYLTVVETPFEDYKDLPRGTWSGAVSSDELLDVINSRYPGKLTGKIEKIEYQAAGGGYIHLMTITDTDGNSITLTTSSAVRSLFGKYAYSANFTIGRTFIPSDDVSGEISVITANGIQTADSKDGLIYLTSDSRKRTYGMSDVFYIDGRGYGHGVGMSQYGAQHAALAGFTYKEILSTYYPGTTLNTMY